MPVTCDNAKKITVTGNNSKLPVTGDNAKRIPHTESNANIIIDNPM